MSSSNALPNLTRDNILGFGVVLLIAVTIIFTSLNTGTGNKTKVHGTVISIGINSSQPYKLPSRLITVQLNNGQVVTVKAKHTDHISKGDNVTLVKTDKALSSASEYELSSEQP